MPTPRKQALTPEAFFVAGSLGLNQTEVGQLHSVSERRVRQLLEDPENREAYERGKADVKRRLVSKVLEMADAGNATALIWAMKNMAGWSDQSTTRNETNINVTQVYIAEWGQPAAVGAPMTRGQLKSAEEDAEDADWDEV